MGKAKTKDELIDSAQINYDKLHCLIQNMTIQQLSASFDFSRYENKKEAHWKRDKNLRDVLIHLYEWHRLLLDWVEANSAGVKRPFLPEPYNWKNYGSMNLALWEKHQKTDLSKAQEELEKSHHEVMGLVIKLSNEELFTKNYFDWVGGSTLGAYFLGCTTSHYDWALKKIKAHIKIFT
jgi:hypothetical protein